MWGRQAEHKMMITDLSGSLMNISLIDLRVISWDVCPEAPMNDSKLENGYYFVFINILDAVILIKTMIALQNLEA